MNQNGKTKKSKARAKQSGTRVEFRTTQRKKDLIDYYSNKDDISKAEFIEKAIDYYIAYLNNDYDIPHAHVVRINQLVANQELMRQELRLLRQSVNNGFQTILRIEQDID